MDRRNDESNAIAIIGAPRTGKTTLAVGLYATSTPAFSVSPVGDETRRYIEIRKAAMENGYWPAATLEQENLDLRFRLHANGRATDIAFREYMGERMGHPTYIRDVIGSPAAAMMLLNPGMPGLRDAESRNSMIGNLKVVCQHLKDSKCVAVAFVVTASDRLSSDLAPFRDEFESYASEITNQLDNIGLKWRRFDVTVSGRLEDQNRPVLAKGETNTSRAPFLWLLSCIRSRSRFMAFAKIAAVALVAASLSAAFVSFRLVRSAKAISRLEQEADSIALKLDDAWRRKDPLACATAISELRLLETNGLKSVSIWGSASRERLATLDGRLKAADDAWSVKEMALELSEIESKISRDATLLQSGWDRSFSERLSSLDPRGDEAINDRAALLEEWNAKREALQVVWQTAALERQSESKAIQAKRATGERILAQLKDGYDFLMAMERDYPLAKNREEAASRINASRVNALEGYCNLIAQISPDSATPPCVGAELKRKIAADLAGRASDGEIRFVEDNLLERQQMALDKWRLRQRQLAEGFSADGDIKDAVRSYGEFLDDWPENPWLSEVHAKMESRLEAYFIEFIEEWNAEFRGADGRTPIAESGVNAPARMERAQDGFNRFKQVCMHVSGKGWKGSPVRDSVAGRFARLCASKGSLGDYGINAAFAQALAVKKIEVLFDPATLDSDYKELVAGVTLQTSRWNPVTAKMDRLSRDEFFKEKSIPKSENGRWVVLWPGEQAKAHIIRTNPWTFASVEVAYGDRMSNWLSTNESGTHSMPLYYSGPGLQEYERSFSISLSHGGWNDPNTGTLFVRITYEGKGPDFATLWQEACKEGGR